MSRGYLFASSLEFAGEQPEMAWYVLEEWAPPETAWGALEETGVLIRDWAEAVCAAHPDWTGPFVSLSTALCAARLGDTA